MKPVILSLIILLASFLAACSSTAVPPTPRVEATPSPIISTITPSPTVTLTSTATLTATVTLTPTYHTPTPSAGQKVKTFSDPACEGYFYYNSPTYVSGFIYIGTSRKYFDPPITTNCFFKLDTGLNKIWSHSLGSSEVRGSAVLDSSGNIYFIVERGRLTGDTSKSVFYLYSLANDGSFRWEKYLGPQNSAVGAANLAVGADDTIYAGSNQLYAFDPTGKILWIFGSNLGVMNAPIIDAEGSLFFVSHRTVFSVTRTGQFRWSYAAAIQKMGKYGNGDGLSSPAFSTDRQSIYVAINTVVYRLESKTGKKLWEYSPPNMEGDFRATPAVDDQNNVYLGSKSDKDSVFYAI